MATTTTVAASAVVASPSIASEIIPSATPSPADAELLRLGAEFDRFRDAMLIAEAENNRLLEAAHAPIEALRHDHEAFAAALEKLDDSKIPGFLKVDGLLKEISEQIDRVLKSMIEIQPASFSSVAVKLRAMRWLTGFDEDTPDASQDWDEEWFNTIDRDVRRLAANEASPRGHIESKAAVDPIFAAIENHRHAICELYRTEDEHPDDDDSEYVRAAHSHMDDTAIELTNVRPTTMAGIFALLTYVNQINTGKVHLPGYPDRHTEEEFWPCELSDDSVKNPRGRVLELPFPYWIMENIRAAILEIRAAA
ncbi:MAG: hypothetical protein DCC74_10500 [Proteobacteria bacterium]|nr:MAG: hypothetical protein DCC74_10500 [Pseudomonadota bacterium]